MPKVKRAKVKWNHLPQRSRNRDKYETAFRQSLKQSMRDSESEEEGGVNSNVRRGGTHESSSSSEGGENRLHRHHPQNQREDALNNVRQI